MVTVTSLWLAVLLSAVLVFVVSAVLHMGPFWHKNDYPKVPNEDGLMDALRPFSLPVGDYAVPRASSGADMKNPAFLENMARGPIMVITVRAPGPPTMAGSLAKWFIFCVIVSLFVAYVVTRALPPRCGLPQSSPDRRLGGFRSLRVCDLADFHLVRSGLASRVLGNRGRDDFRHAGRRYIWLGLARRLMSCRA